jgi:superfamily I DNA/RNA helicase
LLKNGSTVTDYQLNINYRSTEAIVTIANSIMRYIPTLAYKEKMLAIKEGGERPEVHFFLKNADEYDWVVAKIAELRKVYKK